MLGFSMPENIPLSFDELSYLTLSYYGFDGNMLLLERVRGILSITVGVPFLLEFLFCIILWYTNRIKPDSGDVRCRKS